MSKREKQIKQKKQKKEIKTKDLSKAKGGADFKVSGGGSNYGF